VALQEPRQALDALKRHGCLVTPPPSAAAASLLSPPSLSQHPPTSPSSPVQMNPLQPPSSHRGPPNSFPHGSGVGSSNRGSGLTGGTVGEGGQQRGGPPESATSTPGHDFLMRGGGSPLGATRKEESSIVLFLFSRSLAFFCFHFIVFFCLLSNPSEVCKS